ncbi:hypothetical protein EMCG_06510 [[Emmonsia] crescens]|uniref:Uncharacterized protein n=1 Tax=[Emmonsia] crescens TaxID=73230 RepID=A0A0G2IBD1_9EURO|nr:hypothetical protein EMCG_06510 [Emmonsia crescens UAMH 3008]
MALSPGVSAPTNVPNTPWGAGYYLLYSDVIDPTGSHLVMFGNWPYVCVSSPRLIFRVTGPTSIFPPTMPGRILPASEALLRFKSIPYDPEIASDLEAAKNISAAATTRLIFSLSRQNSLPQDLLHAYRIWAVLALLQGWKCEGRFPGSIESFSLQLDKHRAMLVIAIGVYIARNTPSRSGGPGNIVAACSSNGHGGGHTCLNIE